MTLGDAEFGSGLVVTSSMVDTVMIHLAEQVAPGIDVIFLDTGYHFVETIGTRDAVDAGAQRQRDQRDPGADRGRAGRRLRQGPVRPRPRPVLRAAQGRSRWTRPWRPYAAWASGLRRADSPARANTPVVSWDAKRQDVKVAPIATWTDDDVDALHRDATAC